MPKRRVEKIRPQMTASINMQASITPVLRQDLRASFDDNVTNVEFRAMLNGGELVKIVVVDPYFTKFDKIMGSDYFRYSRDAQTGPLELSTEMGWRNEDGGGKTLYLDEMKHVVVSMTPHGDTNLAYIELLAVDYPSYYLAGGDAGGGSYEGNVQSVIKEIVAKYSRRQLEVQFDTKTKDSKYNRWWEYRQDPKSLILSLLEWSSSVTEHQTRWLLWPDGKRLIIKEQADDQSQERSVYEWRGYGGDIKGTGDIREWEVIGDNALQLSQTQLVTAGMSAVSGTYYDPKQFIKNMDKVFVGDPNTANKYKPSVPDDRGYTKPNPRANPLDNPLGWTMIPAIPEFSAGDMGMKYDQFVDGRARGMYLAMVNALERIRVRVTGHSIWNGSEGLGVDTIRITITASQDGAPPYFIAGNWLVYGFHHIATRGMWWTDLYCSRLDYDSDAKAVGNIFV